MLCDSCILNFATNINASVWSAYLPESNFQTKYLTDKVAKDTFVASQTFDAYSVGQTYISTVYYNAWGARGNATQAAWLSANCRNALNNNGASNKGAQGPYTFTLPAEDVEIHLYPYFCQTKGQVRSILLSSPQILTSNQTTVYYYVPASMIENPITRAANYVVQFDGHAMEGSLITEYDAMIETGLTPEFVAFGPGFGTPTNPWADGGAARSYQLTPYSCFDPTPMPSCGNWGGGFQMGDFLYDTALPALWTKLAMEPVGRSHLTLTGHSNGGLMACALAYSNSSRWSAAYCGSGSFWMNNQQFSKIVAAQTPEHPLHIFIDVGGREQPLIVQANQAVYSAMLAKNDFVLGDNLMFALYSKGADSHQFSSWSARTPLAFAFLFNHPVKRGSFSRNGQQYDTLAYEDVSRPFSLSADFTIPFGPKSSQQNGALEGQ
jgi:predicted alpha/beta superfamily hydrolase